VLIAGARFSNLLGKRGMQAMERLSGLILVAIAVEMLLHGVREFVRTL
jgi:small neutral amino acid transporter SnatA (MarC family)